MHVSVCFDSSPETLLVWDNNMYPLGSNKNLNINMYLSSKLSLIWSSATFQIFPNVDILQSILILKLCLIVILDGFWAYNSVRGLSL